jgi:FMN phosphatase YigB (HAD superfamily)
MMVRTPVFDIGDTLVPSHSKINEIIQDVVPEAPEMDINRYNVYVPEELNEFLADNGLEQKGEEITSRYLDWKSEYLKENTLPELKKINEDFGPIGFISDNSIPAKEFYQENFREFGIEYRGFVVSEEIGAEKPDPRIFQAFLDKREQTGSNFVYFGNYVDRDKAAEEVGMNFVWVKQFHTFGSSKDGPQIEKLDYESVSRALEQVSDR